MASCTHSLLPIGQSFAGNHKVDGKQDDYNGTEVTILVSKNAGRYRVQAAKLEALYLVSAELVRRLTAHYKVGG